MLLKNVELHEIWRDDIEASFFFTRAAGHEITLTTFPCRLLVTPSSDQILLKNPPPSPSGGRSDDMTSYHSVSFPPQFVNVQIDLIFSKRLRFSSRLSQKGSTLYWIRTNRNGHDNVAIGDTPFQENYRCVLRSFFLPYRDGKKYCPRLRESHAFALQLRTSLLAQLCTKSCKNIPTRFWE